MKKEFVLAIVFIMLVTARCGLAETKPGQAEFKADGVNVTVDIQSNIYTYKVTNLSNSPIVRFEIKQHAAYNFKTPEGWQKETSTDTFLAWTDNLRTAIVPNETKQFSLRVSSKGAVLGFAPVTIQFQTKDTITISDVWAPIGEPRSYILLVIGLLVAILLTHTIILNRRNKCEVSTATNGV
ncbi:MAG: hypothetical protein KAS75_07650 [Planctomycetes bacterium]|nr:hypothetical protein [Planctomycetota bacterium]